MFASLLSTASAQANDTQPDAAEQPAVNDAIWPVDCTRDVQRDGLVLIDAALGLVTVSLRPSDASEDLPGAFAADQGDMRVWKSSEPLLPQTEYRLSIQQLDAQGAALGEARLSHFTTGDALAGPLALNGVPAARVLPHTAAASDSSAFSAESLRDDVAVLRVALPGLDGGLSHRALALTATLLEDTSSEQALGARITDSQRAAPHQPVAFQLQAVLGDEPSRRCIAISASDGLGAPLQLPDFCMELPARPGAELPAAQEEAPYEAGVSAQARELTSSGELDVGAVQASAGGCSLSSENPGRDLSWLVLALLPFLAARRRAGSPA